MGSLRRHVKNDLVGIVENGLVGSSLRACGEPTEAC